MEELREEVVERERVDKEEWRNCGRRLVRETVDK